MTATEDVLDGLCESTAKLIKAMNAADRCVTYLRTSGLNYGRAGWLVGAAGVVDGLFWVIED
jgi:hypothetical protein